MHLAPLGQFQPLCRPSSFIPFCCDRNFVECDILNDIDERIAALAVQIGVIGWEELDKSLSEANSVSDS